MANPVSEALEKTFAIRDQPFAYRVVCGCGESDLTDDAAEATRIAHKFAALHRDDGPVRVYSLKPVAMTTITQPDAP